ncbi:MAG: DUF4397 domain-containing protein [Actinomycetota bacterium]
MSEGNDSTTEQWFGHDRVLLSDDEHTVEVTVGPEGVWDRTHLRRLRQSGELPGLVPVIDADVTADGTPYAVTPRVEAASLRERIGEGLPWGEAAGITEAAARAIHEAHLRNLYHGALSPDDVYVVDESVAVAGIGMGHGGTPPADREEWTAPEVRNGANPTERSDVYSLGKMLETGLGDDVESAPRSIRRLIMWSSSDTPEARPPSAMEFASILAEGLDDDRRTYGPAFISTSGMTGLAAGAGAAASGIAGGGSGAAAAAAGLAAAGGAAALAATSLGGDGADAETASADADATVEADVDPADLDAASDDTAEVGASTAAAAASDYTVPEAARTTDIEREDDRGGWIPWAVGALLVLAALALFFGMVTGGDDDDPGDAGTTTTESVDTTDSTDGGDDGDDGTDDGDSGGDDGTDDGDSGGDDGDDGGQTATSGAQTTTTADDDTTTTSEATTSTSEATTSTTEATTTTAAPVDVDALVPTAQGPIDADDAGVSIVHGVPGAEVDVYVNDDAVAVGFTSGSIAGPVDLPAADYDLDLFAAGSPATAKAADRTDDAILSGSVPIGADPSSVVAHLDAGGAPTVSVFVDDLSSLDPGRSRVTARHLAAGESADIVVDDAVVATLAPGETATLEVPAGEVSLAIADAAGNILISAPVNLADGELTVVSAIGATNEGELDVVVQRYSGLGTAPTGVPTGDSGLLGENDRSVMWIVYPMIALMLLGGVGLALRSRRRRWS